nr:uncharacterized protein LOC129261738 [Lytechinus pictus]
MFECAEGYLFEGSDTARCGLSGELNGSIPDCNILCEVDYISPLTNINSACPAGTKITENTQCDFSCPTGYNLVGNSTVYCMANGLLSDQIGCESINKCSTLPCSADANSFCVNRLGTFQCSCYEGYENSIENPQCSPGTPTIACQIDSCMNGGTCNQEPTTFTCTCPSGFTGMMCQNDLRCNDVVCEDTQTCFQGVCVCQDGRAPVNGVCEESCSQSCVLEQERCVISSCRCRTTWFRREIGNGVSRCSKASRLLRISYILLAINGVQVNFDAAYRDPQSAEYIAGAEVIRYVIPRVLKARGVGGVITSVVLGYFNGSLGVDSAVSVDETFVGDETTLTDALMQEMIEGQDHLTADNTSLRINMASLNVAEITEVDECADGSHDCDTNALCINTDPGLGFDCLCNEGYDDLYPASLPGRYCFLASPSDPDETRSDIAGGTMNVALIAGLVPGLGIVLVVIFTCACFTFVRSQRKKNMAEMMFGDRPTSLNHYSRNDNDELSYRKESSQSDVYYLYPGSSGNSSIKTGYSHRSRNPVSTNRRSVSSAIYNKAVSPYRKRHDVPQCVPQCVHKNFSKRFAEFFREKVSKVVSSFNPAIPAPTTTPSTEHNFSRFRLISDLDIQKLTESLPSKHCNLDPIHTWLQNNYLEELIPVITKCINISLSTGIVPRALKTSLLLPLLKNLILDPNSIGNYRPIAKVLERVTSSSMRSSHYDYPGSRTNNSTTVNGQPKGERGSGSRRSTTSTIYNSIATIYE